MQIQEKKLSWKALKQAQMSQIRNKIKWQSQNLKYDYWHPSEHEMVKNPLIVSNRKMWLLRHEQKEQNKL